MSEWQGVRFARVPAELLADPTLTLLTKCVYAALAARADARTGWLKSSRQRIVADVGSDVQPQSVSRAIAALEAGGWLTREKHRGSWSHFIVHARRQLKSRPVQGGGFEDSEDSGEGITADTYSDE